MLFCLVYTDSFYFDCDTSNISYVNHEQICSWIHPVLSNENKSYNTLFDEDAYLTIANLP